MSWKEVFEKGIASFKSGKLPEALSYMNQAAELQKDNYKIYDSRAAVHEKLGNLKDALLDSKNVINLAPQQWQGYTRAARVFSSLGKPESAIKMVDLALTRLRSDDPRYRGQLLDLREKAVQAQTATKKQHRLHLVEAAYHLGKLPTEIITEIFRIVVEADHSLVSLAYFIAVKQAPHTQAENMVRAVEQTDFYLGDQLKGLSWSHLEAIHVHSSFLVELQRLLTEISMTCVISNLKQLSLDECGSMDAIFTPDREWNLRELRSTGLTQFPETCWATLAQLRVLHLHKLPTQIPLSAIAAVPLLENLIIEFVQPMTILGAVDEPLHMVHLTSMELRNVENPFTVLGNGILEAGSCRKFHLLRVDPSSLECEDIARPIATPTSICISRKRLDLQVTCRTDKGIDHSVASMHDSDDEYYSDFTLDDRTLAILVEEESKFTRSASTQAATAGSSPPPKRQKVATSWNAARPVQRNESVEDMDDLPDISVQMDGTYALQDRQRTTSPAPSSHLPTTSGPCLQPQRGLGPGVSSSRGSFKGDVTTVETLIFYAYSTHRHPPFVTEPTPVPVRASLAYKRYNENWRFDLCTPSLREAIFYSISVSLQLQKSNDRMQAALQKSQAELHNVLDAKFAKEGEVSILRKGIEKVNNMGSI
ncbi:hypothetical protein ID866_513 [Astraeus odoratus]|nr:hypothetical protein ID866_513 [Astraeus odoratus]